MNSKIALVVAVLLFSCVGCDSHSEVWVSNATGTCSFCCMTTVDNILNVKVIDGKGTGGWLVDTRASCHQKYDVVWIDDATILVASSDIGFLLLDVANRCMLNKLDLRRVTGKYLVRVLNDQGECERSIAVAEGLMPKTSLLKYVEHAAE